MNNIICNDCGHIKIVIGTDFYDERCEICGGKMYLKDEVNKDDEIANTLEREEDILTDDEVAHRICIASMEQNLETLGHRKSWDIIEGFADPKQRIVYRQLFFEAGGKI